MESTILATGFVMIVLLMTTESTPVSRRARALTDELQMPETCSTQTYCIEKHNKYPQEDIDKLLEKFNVSLGDPHEINVARDGFELAEQNDCKKNYTYGKIHEIRDTQHRVRAVVQGAHFAQIIRIEYCLFPYQAPATKRFKNAVANHIIVCRNESMSYNFLVLSLDRKRFESVRGIDIPVNCACRYVRPKN